MKGWGIACGAVACVVAVASCEPIPSDAVHLNPTEALSLDLIAHWTFDESTGATANDDSGHGLDGAVTGGTRITDGRFGGAINFKTGDYVKVSNFHDLPPPITVSAWVRMTADDLGHDWGAVVATEVDRQGGWLLYVDNTSNVRSFDFEYALSSSRRSYLRTIDQESIAPDVWHHLTAVVSDSAMTLYHGTEVAVAAAVTTSLGAGASPLYIGWWSGNDGQFTGAIDDVRIYRRALSPAEIKLLDSTDK